MENPVYNRIASALWVALIILVVILATYVSVGRLLTANLANFRVEILEVLNERLPFGIEAQQVSGEWQSFTPALILTGLRVSLPGSDSPPLELSQGWMGVDVLNSLRTRSLQMTDLVLEGLSLRGELSRDGGFKLVGFEAGSGRSVEPLREFLLNVERISLRNNRLILTVPDGEVRDLSLDLELSRKGSQRHVQATLDSSAGARISIVAQGLGSPFSPELFSGQAYMAMQSAHLGAVKDMFVQRLFPAWADGTVDLELWLNWDKGEPSVEARLNGGELLVAADDASWQLPLQHIALEARLLQSNDRWTLFVANLQVANGDVEWTLPRLQVDTRDNTLRVRTSDFSLAPINAILTHPDTVSDTLSEVFAALQPRGHLSALQVTINDVTKLESDWQIAANFEDLAVESWHGAPGATAATGYAQIAASGGFVILDGQSMSLDFPAVFLEPLHFEDLYGTLNLDWDAGAVRLASGLLTTRGEEGVAKVLFGLNIPLQSDDVGIEMDLLVGLHDTHPVHRIKYIPYILDPGLLTWLQDSIGEGDIEQGAFLWRGSLREGAAEHRTVQLAFNVADTQLRYHPQWPPVLVEQGVVLIDDSNVSVWAERASLYESRVDRLSVETRSTAAGDITLDLQGSVRGPVSDGFKVLNESPLANVVGSTFAAWTASGQLDTDLRLQLNLSDNAAPPRVDVATVWRDVELLVTPGNLPLQSLNGEFEYSTTTGFSATGLAATLWGNAVTATLRQQHTAESGVYDPATTVVSIDLDARVDLADLRRWLQIESLAFASGQTAADLEIRLSPGAPAVLTVDSDLRGVSLDLPQPWQKEADELRDLHLEIPLANGVLPLSLQLGEALQLRLDLEAGIVHGGALGISQPAEAVQTGVFHVTGHAALLQVDEWLALAERYVGDMDSILATVAGSDTRSNAVEDISDLQQGQHEDPVTTPLKIAVDELRADTVVIFAQELQDVVFDLALDRAHWQLSVATDWLRGDLSSAGEGAPLQLAVDYLDIDALPGFKQADSGSDSSWELPRIDVSLSNIFQSEQRLGELRFALHAQSNVVHADAITGELASLRLGASQPGKLEWHRGSEPYTELQANLHFDDLGQTLEYFDYQRIVQTQGGDIEVEFRWPGGPQDFVLAEGEGTLQLHIGPGSFLDAPAGAAGALRVVSILNLADMVQRLSLANTFEAGIPFDSVQGEIEVRDAMLTVARMDVEGGSSFKFSGVSDLQTRTLDGQLVATLPVVNNLPWIAALAASLPVAAGVFVVSQVFSKQMNRLSSAVYTIGGSWNEPEVNFDRIFDNTPDTASTGAEVDVDAPQDNTVEKESSDSAASPALDQAESP